MIGARTPHAGQFLLGIFFALLLAGMTCHAQTTSIDERLQQADRVKTSNHPQFTALLQSLTEQAAQLSPDQHQYLQYLQGWEAAYSGNYAVALRTLAAVTATNRQPELRVRALTTRVNVLTIARRFEEAFSELSALLAEVDLVDDPMVREQALTVAALVYGDLGQYDLSILYAERVIAENASGLGECRGGQVKTRSMYDASRPGQRPAELEGEIDKIERACVATGEFTYANAIRALRARLLFERKEVEQARELLERHLDEVVQSQYPRLISQYHTLLAEVYWSMRNVEQARRSALRAIESAVPNEFTEPIVSAYRLLYTIDKARGQQTSALEFHEKYAAADKAYLDHVTARQLAFERVKHEVAANKLQIESLKLQRELDAKEIENVRLYVALLIAVLAFIAYWAYRTKRSQLHFMNLSRRDGLTGIINRPHFMDLARSTLENCSKLQQEVALILFDLDHFKQINDRFGHAAGDAALKRVVTACQAHLRAADVFARLGGEEFCVLLPACSLTDASDRAEELRKAMAELSETSEAKTTASLGVASTAESGYELNQLLAHADQALYRAKHNGRNQVVAFEKIEQTAAECPA